MDKGIIEIDNNGMLRYAKYEVSRETELIIYIIVRSIPTRKICLCSLGAKECC